MFKRNAPPLFLALPILSLFLVSLAFPAIAQEKPTSSTWPKYDLKAETKIKGTVSEIKPVANGTKPAVELVLKEESGTVEVYLCPQAFLKDMGVDLKAGDEVEIKGSKVKEGDTDVILAREVNKGTDTIVLRDDKGMPVWNWQKKT